jgi:ABC-2 type transport system permease protein
VSTSSPPLPAATPAARPRTPDAADGAGRLAGPFDPRRAEPRPADAIPRTLRAAARLGWAIESNWSDPLLFAIYSIVKPVGAVLLLVALVWVVGSGGNSETIAYLVVGSAAWTFVGGGLIGLVQTILDDREHYRVLKYVIVSPSPFLAYLVGRSGAQLVVATIGCLVVLALGVLLLGVPIDPRAIDWPLLAISMVLGLAGLMALGIGLAGFCLQLRQEAWSYPEAVAGGLYLLSGAIFPVDVLPAWLQPVAFALAPTWWLEGLRRALLGRPTPGIMATIPDTAVVGALAVTAAGLVVAGLAIFRVMLRRARDRGLIDQLTGS